MANADLPVESWWDSPKAEVHEDLAALLGFLDQNQAHHKTDATRHMRLYGNLDVGLGPFRYARSESNLAANRVTLNVVKSCCDSLTAKIAQAKPRPLFMTTDGDHSAQRRAKLLQRFIDGVFYENDAYQVGQRAFLDFAVLGTGIIGVYRKGDKVAYERVFPAEITVDDAEGIYGKPANLYRRKQLPRTRVLAMFKKQSDKNKILAAAAVDPLASGQNVADLIEIREAWHLASAEGEEDGRHVVAIDGATLIDEPYPHTYFPFVFFRPNQRLLGFWGCGIAEQLVGIQLEINRLLRTITAQMSLLSAPKVLVEAGSKIVSSHLTNEIGTILNYIGTRPEIWLPQTVHQELFAHLERLVNYAYEITGVSQMSATSQKPAGLDSGKALREYSDIESERFVVVGQAYERMFVELAQITMFMMKEIAQERGRKGLSVRLQGKKTIRAIDWAEIELDTNEYVLQIFPVSSLPSTPAGKLQTIQEMLQAGLIPQEDAVRLLDFPDLEAVNNQLTAALEDLDMVIEQMLDEGLYSPPEPYQNLELGLKRFQSAYLRARVNKVEEERLELLRRWMLDAREMLDVASQQATAPDQTQVSVAPESTEREAPPPDMLANPQGAPPPAQMA